MRPNEGSIWLTDVVGGREAAVCDAPIGEEPDVELVGGGCERRRRRVPATVAAHQRTVRVGSVSDLWHGTRAVNTLPSQYVTAPVFNIMILLFWWNRSEHSFHLDIKHKIISLRPNNIHKHFHSVDEVHIWGDLHYVWVVKLITH